MMFSNRLDLDRCFHHIQDQEYAIIKFNNDFPNYYQGSDIDIFCTDGDEFAIKVLEFGNKYIRQGFDVKVDSSKQNKIYIDFYFNDEIDFRFDIYKALPQYENIRIKKWFFYSVIDRRKAIERKYDENEYHVYVPDEIDDFILRYIEYLEWYEKRPDKIGHLEYVRDRLSSNSKRDRFFDRLYLYAEMPDAAGDGGKFHISKKIYRSFLFSTANIRNTPLKDVPKKVIKKLYRLLLTN